MNRPAAIDDLPAVGEVDWLNEIRRWRRGIHNKIVVLDDDPTGTQTVHGVPVLTTWSVDDLASVMSSPSDLFYLLTNSRALTEQAAVELAKLIGQNLIQAGERTGTTVSLVSRSDSTLRGHFPAEVDAVAGATGRPEAVRVLCPFFLQGGRFTVEDVHYVVERERWTPAAETPFARDATFGFTQSHLADWLVEKHDGGYSRDRVHSVSLAELRHGDTASIARRLCEIPPGDSCIVNAIAIEDVQAFCVAVLEAESLGAQFIFRTAASFVQAYAGLSEQPLLSGPQMRNENASAGLMVVGSYVPKTTAQLDLLRQNGRDLEFVVMDVDQILGDGRDVAVLAAIDQVNQLLGSKSNVVLQTSRRLVTGTDGVDSLRIGSEVSRAVVDVVRGVRHDLRFLIAKGGITSSDVATKGLDVKRAEVLGQILPGVPVWKLANDSGRPGLSYVVFPGNVGGDDALLQAYEKLK